MSGLDVWASSTKYSDRELLVVPSFSLITPQFQTTRGGVVLGLALTQISIFIHIFYLPRILFGWANRETFQCQ